jgi:transcriptional repressor NrdR
MELLKTLDPVAYVRFASVYREFKDVRDFVDELEPILAETILAQTNLAQTNLAEANAQDRT